MLLQLGFFRISCMMMLSARLSSSVAFLPWTASSMEGPFELYRIRAAFISLRAIGQPALTCGK
jgi:hypothetical protein